MCSFDEEKAQCAIFLEHTFFDGKSAMCDFSRTYVLRRKKRAKVLLFFELAKFLYVFFQNY